MQNLGPQNEKVLSSKLNEILKGPTSTRSETSDNAHARNIRFELGVAARLNSLGIPSQLKEPNPDIESRWKGKRVAIECKRLYTSDKLTERIEEAESQLRNRPNSKAAALKMIFVDMTRIVTKGKLHAHGDRSEVMRAIVDAQRAIAHDVAIMMAERNMRDIDAIVLVYQDFIEPLADEYMILGVTQSAVILNDLQIRRRRRLMSNMARKLGPDALAAASPPAP